MASGWYPDPDGRPHQRWFNGVDWTNELAPSGSNPPRLSIVGDSGFTPTPAPAPSYSAAPSSLPTLLATAPAPATGAQFGIDSLPAYAPDAPIDAPSYGVQTSSAFHTGLSSVPPTDGPPALPGLSALPTYAASTGSSMAPPSTPAFPSLSNLPGPNVAGALAAPDVRLALAPTTPYLESAVPQTGVGFSAPTSYQASPEVAAPVAAPAAPQTHRHIVQGHSGVATPADGTTLPVSDRPRAQRALDIATRSSALGIAYDRADYGAASPLSTEEEISEAASRAATLAAFASGVNGGLFAQTPPATVETVTPVQAPPAPSQPKTGFRTPKVAPMSIPVVAEPTTQAQVAQVPAYRVPETAAFVPPVTTTPLSSSYQPFAMIPEVRKGTKLAATRTYTVAAWAIALLPLVVVGLGVSVVLFYPEFYSRFAQVGILAVATLVSFALAARDRAELVKAGHARVASAAWMILSPIGYFVARMVATARQSKAGALPLIVFIGLVGALVGAVMLLPEGSLLPAGAEALLLTPGL